MGKMKICQVLGGNEKGGLEKHFTELCASLAERHDVMAIAHPIYRSWMPDNVHFEAVNLCRSRRNPIALWQLARAVRSWHPDIVHAHANKASAMIATIRPFIAAQRVATVHSLKKNVRMFNHFDQVIAVSNHAAEQLSNPNIEVIYNGIVPPVFLESSSKEKLCREFSLSGQRPVLIAVGRLVPVKGFDLLIRAMQGVEADLLIVGDGSERAVLESLAAQLLVNDRVHFLGHRNDVPSLLAGADLTIIASRKEGFPYVLVEALHVRQVVLSTDVPGSADLLPKQMLIPCENVSALHRGILNSLENCSQILKLYEPLWAFAVHELTLDGMVRKIEKLYSEVLSRDGAC